MVTIESDFKLKPVYCSNLSINIFNLESGVYDSVSIIIFLNISVTSCIDEFHILVSYFEKSISFLKSY